MEKNTLKTNGYFYLCLSVRTLKRMLKEAKAENDLKIFHYVASESYLAQLEAIN